MINTLKNIFVWFLIVLAFGAVSFWDNWAYPIREVSKPSCRWEEWNSLDSDCIMQLPRIENADYERYKNDLTYRILYTVLRASSYNHGWDVGHWGHMWIDIATAQWTPVYAIGDGEVITAGWLQGWWNTVVVKHQVDWNTIYAGYGHLHSIDVSPWQNVTKDDKLGGVGTTWNSTGNHLHFQLDIEDDRVNQSPPYFFSKCNIAWEIKTTWTDDCLEYVTKYSLDPIEFLETNWANIEGRDSWQVIEETEKRRQEKKETLDPDSMMDREAVRLSELEMFLARYDMYTSWWSRLNPMDIGDQESIDLNVRYDHNNRPFSGLFPELIEFEYDEDIIDVFPSSMRVVQDGQRQIEVTARGQGTTRLRVRIGNVIIDDISVRVVGEDTVLKPQRAIFQNIGRSFTIGSSNIWLAYFQDENNSNIINVPFEWRYTVKSDDKSKLCPIPYTNFRDINKIENYECSLDELVDSFEFDFSDTIANSGLLIFKIYWQKPGRTEISIYDTDGQMANWMYNVRYPVDIDQSDVRHQQAIRNMLEKGIVRNDRNNYFQPNTTIRETDAIDWIENVFAGYDVNKIDGNRFHRLSRLEFVQTLSKMTWVISSDTERHFWDIDQKDRKYANLLVDMDISFIDGYDRYFQPDRQIERWEVAHILDEFYNLIN